MSEHDVCNHHVEISARNFFHSKFDKKDAEKRFKTLDFLSFILVNFILIYDEEYMLQFAT